jgi:hypothetical protein
MTTENVKCTYTMMSATTWLAEPVACFPNVRQLGRRHFGLNLSSDAFDAV